MPKRGREEKNNGLIPIQIIIMCLSYDIFYDVNPNMATSSEETETSEQEKICSSTRPQKNLTTKVFEPENC